MRWMAFLLALLLAGPLHAATKSVSAVSYSGGTFNAVCHNMIGIYLNMRDSTDASGTQQSGYVGQFHDGVSQYTNTRLFERFTVSALAGSTATAASIKCRWKVDESTNDELIMVHVATQGNTADVGDWNEFDEWQSSGVYTSIASDSVNMSTFSADAYFELDLNATGLSGLNTAINGAGEFYVVLLSSGDNGSIAPTSTQRVQIYMWPTLELTYDVTPESATGPTTTRALGTVLHNPDPIIRPNLGTILNEVFRNP